jgi:5-methylcytosine-specific restriction endonuclease McrA
MTRGSTLVLNATFEPLGIVSSRRALLLVLGEKADVLHATQHSFRSERLVVPEPSVVRLLRYVPAPRTANVPVNRRTVFARDASTCQYCGAAAEGIDHVVPRSRGGQHRWENVVAACRRCNNRKADRHLHEVGMELHSAPVAPRHRLALLTGAVGARSDWLEYLDCGPVGLRSRQRSA